MSISKGTANAVRNAGFHEGSRSFSGEQWTLIKLRTVKMVSRGSEVAKVLSNLSNWP